MTELEKLELKRKKEIYFLYETLDKDLKKLLDDKDIIEIMLNQDGSIWVEKFGVGTIKTELIIDKIHAKKIIEIIASNDGKSITKKEPIISSILPNGERFEGILYEPVNGNPIFAIRKKSERIITLDEYIKNNVLTFKYKEYILNAIQERKNILIVGGTSTGKTTFANALLNEMKNLKDRVIILEDTPELECSVENKVKLKTTIYTNMSDLLKSCMRLNPDRIIVGELRSGKESIELLKAWNSGHSGGLSTIHANDSEAALSKLEQYLAEVSERDQKAIIIEAIDIVVTMIKENNQRKVKEILKVKGYDYTKKEYILENII